MDITYAITPFVAWFMAGSTKFAINSLKAGQPAFDQIGYGGSPSNHSAIVSSMAALIGLREGFTTPLFGIALTLALIVIIDALDLRNRIEQQVVALNRLGKPVQGWKPLRERIGHRPHEVLAGILTGLVCAYILTILFPQG